MRAVRFTPKGIRLDHERAKRAVADLQARNDRVQHFPRNKYSGISTHVLNVFKNNTDEFNGVDAHQTDRIMRRLHLLGADNVAELEHISEPQNNSNFLCSSIPALHRRSRRLRLLPRRRQSQKKAQPQCRKRYAILKRASRTKLRCS